MITLARSRRRTTAVTLRLLGMLLLGMALLPGTPTAQAADTGNLYVKVFYKAGDGSRQPLPGVAVLVTGDTSKRVVCTNQLGIARFKGVAAGVGLTVSTEIRHQPDPFCKNLEFLNPDTGRKMLKASAGPIQVAAGGQEGIRMTMVTPRAQNRVCGGLWATWVGTQGPDTYNGTVGDDVIVGLDGEDVLNGGKGDDNICGGLGSDRLRGGDAGDQEADLLWGEGGIDYMYGGGGNDWLFGGNSSDFLYGESGDDHLFGQDKRDGLDGGEGIDYCETTPWWRPETPRDCEIIVGPTP